MYRTSLNNEIIGKGLQMIEYDSDGVGMEVESSQNGEVWRTVGCSHAGRCD